MTFEKDIIEKEHPDIVVTELVERDIDRLSEEKINKLMDLGDPNRNKNVIK
jgi:hypothetical protein